MMTNEQFGGRVGCSESMASRLRSGKRRPGPDLLFAIMREFDLDRDATEKAFLEGKASFGKLLRETVFQPPRSDDEQKPQVA